MNIETFREYCLLKSGVTESFPFNETVLVFKVIDKMFALTDLNNEFKISLKCDPEKSVSLREEFEAIKPGYHLSSKHWNTISMDGTLQEKLLEELIDHSYELVISKLTKKNKNKLEK